MLAQESAQLGHEEGVVLAERGVDGAERGAARGAVRGQQAIEGVAGPGQSERVTDKGEERRLVHNQPRIAADRLHELGAPDPQPSNLGEELDLEERDRRDAPRPVPVEPGMVREPRGVQDDPEQEVRIEERLQGRLARDRNPTPSSSHSQPHASARPRSGTSISPS